MMVLVLVLLALADSLNPQLHCSLAEALAAA
jgi:hypothetical protein